MSSEQSTTVRNMRALLSGKRLRPKCWKAGTWFCVRDGSLVGDDGVANVMASALGFDCDILESTVSRDEMLAHLASGGKARHESWKGSSINGGNSIFHVADLPDGWILLPKESEK